MWARNITFISLCLIGLAAVAQSLFRTIQLAGPENFDPRQYEHAEFRDVIARIDHEFREQWNSSGVQAANRADDLAIARRLSLGLTGTIPSLEEIRAFETQPPKHRIQWYLTHLLRDRRYADYFAERLARAYVGTEAGPFLIYRRRRFVSWLSDRLHRNDPYDQIVRELISAVGIWTSAPAENFITVSVDQEGTEKPDPVKLAGHVSRAFLGIRLDCVQCHDDLLDGQWSQRDFHQLAAFFAEAELGFTGLQDRPHEYSYKYLHEDQAQVVPPMVPFANELLTVSGERRHQLANWVTHDRNDAFARAIVNRVWALMLGRPRVDPMDDVPLAGDFSRHGDDLRRLIRVIAATEVFQADSRAAFEITPRHERIGSVFPLTRLRPEQVAGAVIQASSLKTIDADSHIFVQLARYNQQNEFIQRYGDTGKDEFGSHGGTVPQRLLLMNGDLVKAKTSDDLLGNAATKIAALAADDSKAIETAFLAVLTRRPTDAESKHFLAKLRDSKGNERAKKMEDIFWTLMNSTEFSWNH